MLGGAGYSTRPHRFCFTFPHTQSIHDGVAKPLLLMGIALQQQRLASASSAKPGFRVSGTQICAGRKPDSRNAARCFCTRADELVPINISNTYCYMKRMQEVFNTNPPDRHRVTSADFFPF